MNTISIVTTQNIELDYDLASLGDRIIGRLLDGLVIAGYVIAIILLIGFGNIDQFFTNNAWMIIIIILPIVLYDLLFELFLNGQSVGKKVMGIKVISLNGAQPALSQYLLRWAFRLVDFSMSGSLVALIMVAASQKKQRLGDLVAHTVLVKTKPRTHFNDTWYQPTPETEYVVTYPEVTNLKDHDIQLIKEVLNSVNRSGNLSLHLHQAKDKIEAVLHIKSKHFEARDFLIAILEDYNHLTSRM